MSVLNNSEPDAEAQIMPDLLTPGEVARLFRVDAKTVSRWAHTGRIRSVVTPGGHHRFYRSDVEALLRGEAPAEDRPRLSP